MGWGFSHFKRCKSFSRQLVQPGILVGGGVLLTHEIILREDYLPCKFNIPFRHPVHKPGLKNIDFALLLRHLLLD